MPYKICMFEFPHRHAITITYNLCTSHIVFVALTYIHIMRCVLRLYNKFGHVRNYVCVNRMDVPEWKSRMEIRKMEMVDMVDCNGWRFSASIVLQF